MHTKANSIERFHRLLESGFQGTEATGFCQFFIGDAAATPFYVEVARDSIRCETGVHAQPTTTVTMSETLFASMIERPDIWDLRNPEVLNNVSVRGDMGMALFLGNIAKTPTRRGQALFEEAERKAALRVLRARDIERLTQPTLREVARRLDEGTPFFITDHLGQSGAWTWSLERIRSTFGHLRIDAFDAVTQAPRTLNGFLDDIEAGVQSYTHGIPLPAPMRPYFKIPLFPEAAFNAPTLWMGRRSGAHGEEPCTALHRDTSHGFLGQVSGTKRVLLCSPDQAAKVYPERAYNLFQSCQIKIWRPDYARFPLSAGLSTLELLLYPGELLVIPVGWFHEMYCSEPVMSVSMFMEWSYLKGLRLAGGLAR